ncbi:hypothetical protein BN1110_06336 [bacterium YEK0313]|nr:hypothetical protein BN1110_06336 [bacterium YEK0313]
MSEMFIKRSAIFSPCGAFRLRLDRDLGLPGRSAAICGVNPSRAGSEVDDQTIHKIYGFAVRNGIGRFAMVNKFAFVATDVRELHAASVADPVGRENDAHIRAAFAEADIVIVAWGSLAKLPPILRTRWRVVTAIAESLGKDLHCLGVTSDGHPRHPLMLSYATPLQFWTAPEAETYP